MKTRSFITPRKADGTGGELVTMEFEPGRPMYLEPVPYWVRDLTEEERAALQREREELLAAPPGLPWAQSVRSETRIKEIDRLLHADRLDRAVERRQAERDAERRRERGEQQARLGAQTVEVPVLESSTNAAGCVVVRHARGLTVLPAGERAANTVRIASPGA